MYENPANVLAQPELTAVAVDYAGLPDGFVADQIAPVVEVSQDTFKYAVWNRADILNIDRTARAIGMPANTATPPKMSFVDGTVGRHALKDSIPDEILSSARNPTQVKNKRVKSIVRKLRVGIDISVKALLDASTNTDTPGVKWDAAANVVIEKNLDAYKKAMRDKLGVNPNTIIIPQDVVDVIRRDSTIRELIKYNPNDLLKSGTLPAPLFGMNVIIPGAFIDSANPGAASSIGSIWAGETVYLLYVDRGSLGDTMTAVAQFRNTATSAPFATKQWRDPDQSANLQWFSSEVAQTEKTLASEAIFKITDVLT